MIQVYVPKDLRQQISQLQEEHRLSNAELILGAIEQTHQDLPSLLRPANAGLFSRDYRPRHSASDDTIQVGVRLLAEDVEQIDRLVSTCQAGSRSAYIVAALEQFFAQRQPQESP